MSVAELRSLIQNSTLANGKKPNEIFLIGGFPHARVDGKSAGGSPGLIYSDLPFEAPEDRMKSPLTQQF